MARALQYSAIFGIDDINSPSHGSQPDSVGTRLDDGGDPPMAELVCAARIHRQPMQLQSFWFDPRRAIVRSPQPQLAVGGFK